MQSSAISVSSPSMPVPSGALRDRVVRFLIARRIQISLVLFLLLMLEDVLVGIKPHDIADWTDWNSVLGLSLVAGGLALRSWAAGTLTKRFQLTMTGPYLLIRNPLYVGTFVIMLGVCQLIDDPENVFFLLGPLIALYALKVRDEECVLSKSFGHQWEQYARATPRFFPRRLTSGLFTDWSFGRWVINREYNALIAGAAGLTALKLWQMV